MRAQYGAHILQKNSTIPQNGLTAPRLYHFNYWTKITRMTKHRLRRIAYQWKRTRRFNGYSSAAGKVTVGLASHWPCVRDRWLRQLISWRELRQTDRQADCGGRQRDGSHRAPSTFGLRWSVTAKSVIAAAVASSAVCRNTRLEITWRALSAWQCMHFSTGISEAWYPDNAVTYT